jgi:TonB-dependent SusC/RagA subfamily outer membrane receptor
MVYRDGESARYVIRGISTNTDATDPLLMIDGVEVPNFDSVLPSQVESVEVIKDGSASIYGNRAGGGVIMITLKKE